MDRYNVNVSNFPMILTFYIFVLLENIIRKDSSILTRKDYFHFAMKYEIYIKFVEIVSV